MSRRESVQVEWSPLVLAVAAILGSGCHRQPNTDLAATKVAALTAAEIAAARQAGLIPTDLQPDWLIDPPPEATLPNTFAYDVNSFGDVVGMAAANALGFLNAQGTQPFLR